MRLSIMCARCNLMNEKKIRYNCTTFTKLTNSLRDFYSFVCLSSFHFGFVIAPLSFVVTFSSYLLFNISPIPYRRPESNTTYINVYHNIFIQMVSCCLPNYLICARKDKRQTANNTVRNLVHTFLNTAAAKEA